MRILDVDDHLHDELSRGGRGRGRGRKKKGVWKPDMFLFCFKWSGK